MSTTVRVLLIVLIVALVVGLLATAGGLFTVRRSWPRVDGRVRVDGLDAEVTVIRDDWGVPHIYAANSHDLFFAQGYVHAQDRFWQMEFWRRAGSGRLAEILGPSALSSDRAIRTFGWHRTAARELDTVDDETLEILEAYAEGVNAYLDSHRGRLGLEFTVLGLNGVSYDPEPWTTLNTLTWAKMMAWTLSGNMNAELMRAGLAARLGVEAVDELVPPYSYERPVIVNEAALQAVPFETLQATRLLGVGEGIGSNNWVIGGERTETGMPLLANDPHLGIQMPSIWYEIGLHCEPVGADCPFNVVGSSFASSPGVIIGHNDHIAWGVTNLGPDVQDLFIEHVNPENPNQYEVNGRWLDMGIVREEIVVAGQDEPVVVNVRSTRHGPIINDIVGGEEENWSYGWQPLALSWTALQPGTLIRSVVLLDQATNWEEFREALSYWDVPSQNFVYADVEGNIGYQAPGRIPIRASGDGTMPVPGWTDDYEWVDYIPFEELPSTFNPDDGYVVTANNAVVGPEYPYLLTMDWASGYRAQRIVDMIEADDSITIQDIQAMHGDSSPLWAEDVLPAVLPLPASGAGLERADEERLAEGLDLLRSWDGRAVRDSAGAALFEAFRLYLIDMTFGDELGDQLLRQARGSLMTALPDLLEAEDSPWFDNVDTPTVETQDEIIYRALLAAIDELSETLGRDTSRWEWGDLHTATFENETLGRSGVSLIENLFNRGPFVVDGTIDTVNNTAYGATNPYDVTSLPSYRQIIDVQDFNRSLSMHTTGQSGHAYHRHYDDMIDPWRNIEYHPMWWQRVDVEANAEGTLILRP